MIKVFLILLLVYECRGVLYRLNGSEYAKMPPVFHLDDYDNCVVDPKGIYCTTDIDLVSDTPSELITLIHNYSDYTIKHFNHTQLHHGVCITQTCKEFYNDSTTVDLKLILEGCLNQSLWKSYKLKCRINNDLYCNNNEDNVSMDNGDIAMGVVIIVIIMCNIIGSLYDIVLLKNKESKGNRYLLCFSVRRNFKKLMSSYQNLEEREERLKGIHGLRTLTMMCVIYSHSLITFSFSPGNTAQTETLYDNIGYYIFLNGTNVVQTFFIISGFLLSYKLEVYAEKRDVKWSLLPYAVVTTWIKLTPTYAFVLGLTCTCVRYAGSGPYWQKAITQEVNDCRSNAWTNLLYINNYLDYTECLEHTWYLGVHMQLCIVGYAACVFAKRGRIRQVVLGILFIIGIVTPAVHTYFQNLDAVLMITPETRGNLKNNPTFNNVYTRGHTNIVNFVMGIALGFLTYRLQMEKVDMKKYQKYRFLFFFTYPAIIGSMFIGSIFYTDGSDVSVLTKAVYAALIKPIFGVIISLLIIGNVFKIEHMYRNILEWNGWKIPSRLCYCAYVHHFLLIRAVVGNITTVVPFSNFRMLEVMITFIVISYIVAIPLWILIDAPFTSFLIMFVFCKKNKSSEQIPENGVTLKTVTNPADEESKNIGSHYT